MKSRGRVTDPKVGLEHYSEGLTQHISVWLHHGVLFDKLILGEILSVGYREANNEHSKLQENQSILL